MDTSITGLILFTRGNHSKDSSDKSLADELRLLASVKM